MKNLLLTKIVIFARKNVNLKNSILKRLFFQGFLTVLFSIPVFSQGYEIKVSFNSKNDTVVLGYFAAKSDRMYSSGTCTLDRTGRGVFRGEEKLPKGLYFLASNGRKLVDFIVGNEQVFEIQMDTTDFINKTKVKGSPENEIFFEFQRMNLKAIMQQHELQQRFQTADSINKRNISEEYQKLNLERAKTLWELIEKSKGLYVSKYLNTQLPMFMRVPAENPSPWQERLPENAATWTKDSLNRYVQQWYRSNFFSNLNIFDPDMLRTPLYEDKLMEYFQPNHVFPFHPDTINAEIDKMLIKAKANDDVFSRVLVTLLNHYIKSDMLVAENIWVYIAEKWYIPFAKWSDADYIEKLKKEVADRKPNLIGKMAPPIEPLIVLPPEHFKAAALDTAIKFDIYAGKVYVDFRKELKSKYTVLFFWDYNCGHCKKAIQELWGVWEELKDKNLQIITVQVVETKEAKGKWIDFVNEHNMFGWVNAWSPYVYEGYKVENHYKTTYSLSSTPQIYLLDESSTIIAKKIGVEHIKDFVR